jgi:transketolase
MDLTDQTNEAASATKAVTQDSKSIAREKLDQLSINTIRFLAVDAIQKAKSGHPGAPMGAAAPVYLLWSSFLKHNPKNPLWFNRDRFVLSAGHASMLLYSLLHLTGYDISLDDIKSFRQWGSKTPGHPEYDPQSGIEVTTGPLGQGFAHGVGMAVAAQFLAAKFNRPGFNIIDHYIYGLVSDGDLEEGISYEAASFAGHHGLDNLIYFYDDNGIQIEGKTSLTYSDNTRKRFEAVHWNVYGPIDGNDLPRVVEAVESAQKAKGRPSLIICRTHIAYGSPGKQDSASAHGEPLGVDEIAATKKNLGWPAEPEFYIPSEVWSHTQQAIPRGEKAEEAWNGLLEKYRNQYSDEYDKLIAHINGTLPDDWDAELEQVFAGQDSPLATRAASGKILNAIAGKVENLMGGSADLGPSNKTHISGEDDFNHENFGARNMHFGVREHSMTAIANGMALHGGMIPYTGTFLVFSDYMKPSIRLAALMGLHVIYVFSHDSIGLGEDGPTHQPIEHLNSLRAIPNLTVIRPADANETMYAWRIAIANRRGPTAIVTTRQKLPHLKMNPDTLRGGYIIRDCEGTPQAIVIASGSEVHLALNAADKLEQEGIGIRVVSMPSCEIFDSQPREYREKVLPPEISRRVSIEAGATAHWYKYIGLNGEAIGIDRFGASAPAKILFDKFGFSAENICERIKSLLG